MSGFGGYGHVDIQMQGDPSAKGAVKRGTIDANRDDQARINQSLAFFTGNMGGLQMVPNAAHDLDARVRAPHSTTGIPYAISGTARNVQVEVSQRLAGFKDPIKAIMGVGVHQEQKIIIRRQYVAGGGAGIVPERAPARTVAIQEDTREVMLTRYGGDIEFNMNLLLRPELAKRELKMKLDAQEAALEQALVRLGYEAILQQGTSLSAALVNSSNHLHNSDPAMHIARIHATTVFGAMNKAPFPVHNILAAAKRAAAYDISRAKKTVMIVPHGLPEMLKFTRPETMVYSVSGVGKDKVDVELEGGYTDPSTNCTIFTHIPPANNDHGAANPYAQESMLSREVIIAFQTNLQGDHQCMDWSEARRGQLTVGNGNRTYYTALKLRMMTGILSVPGSSVGELLLGYPSTSVATNAATESGRMQLRCYLGAAIYKPEDVLLLEDIAFDGIIKGATEVAQNVAAASLALAGAFADGTTADQIEAALTGSDGATVMFKGSKFVDSPVTGRTVIETNDGHLGFIDDPNHWNIVNGYQTYNPGPALLPHKMH